MFTLSKNKFTALFTMFALVASIFTPLNVEAASISINDQRCADNDGVVELMVGSDTKSLTVYNNSAGGEVVVDHPNFQDNFKTVTDLDDGNHSAEVTDNSGNSESVNFTVDCDEDDAEPGEPQILDTTVSCEDGTGTIEAEVKNASYQQLYNNTTGEKPFSGNTSATFLSYSDLENAEYTLTIENSGGDKAEEILTVNCEDKNPDPDTLNCPFSDNGENQWVFDNFSDDRLIAQADGVTPNEETGAVSVNLASGTYDIKIFTSDSYVGREDATQNKEQAYLSLRNSNGEISKTGNTNELEDGSNTAAETTRFSDVSVSQNVTELVGVHPHFTNSNSPNSLNFTCVKLTKEPEEVPDKPEISINNQRCAPEDAADADGVIEFKTPNGLDSYKLINTDSGETLVDDTDGAVNGFVSFSALDDGNYRFEGTLNGFTERINFTVDCDNDTPGPLNCPFSDNGENEWVFDGFSDSGLLSSVSSNPNEETDPLSVDLPSGTYDIEIFTKDSYADRVNFTQEHEQAFLSLRGNNGEIAKTGATTDLRDRVAQASQVSRFSNVNVGSRVKNLVGVHAFYNNSDSVNSLTFDCVKLTKQQEDNDDLNGSCRVSDRNIEPGENVTFFSEASGGEGDYTYSWNIGGTNDEEDEQNTTVDFDDEGDYDGTVTIRDEAGAEIRRTCSVSVDEDDGGGGGGGGGGDRLDPRDDDDKDNGRVRGDRDIDFSVQCLPEDTVYSIGEKVTFNATIDSDDIDEDDIDDFDWGGNNRIEEDDERATVQYTTAGIKEVRVEAEYDGDTESDKCYVQIRGNVAGVSLDQVPYTGPADAAKTIAFILTLLLLGLGGGYVALKYYGNEEIPVGIPKEN